MKRWQIVYGLPLEVWVDIFCYPWISREEFGQLVDRIGNFKFAEHAQFFLHEWGRRTLDMDWVFFDKKGLYKYVNSEPYRFETIYLDVPQTPLPTNIRRYLGEIHIYHFDANTLNFLGHIRPLLTNLDVALFPLFQQLDNFRTILTHFVPLLDTIHSLRCDECVLPMAKQFFGDKFAKLKMLLLCSRNRGEVQQENVNTIVNWLNPLEHIDGAGDDGPRLCALYHRDAFYEQVYTAVRQQFLAATTPPSTFALNMDHRHRPCNQLPGGNEFHLENGIGEHLHGKWIEPKSKDEGLFQITRHGADWSTEELQEWAKKMGDEGRRCLIRFPETTIGSFDAARMDDHPPAVEKKGGQQPCSSKDA